MKSLSTVFILFISLVSFAQNVETNADINHITVFTNRAQISSNVTANLKSGLSKIIISDLASTIDANSIQVGGKGDFVLLAVNFEKDFISKKIQNLEDSLEILQSEIDKTEMLLDVNKNEEEMIMDNTKIKSDTDDLFADDLELMSKYFKKKLTDIGTQKLELKARKKALEAKKTAIENQIKTDPSRKLPLGKIILTVKANKATVANLDLKYLVYGTGWRPNYDIRVANTESPVNLKYKAEVFQNTGVNWNNVSLSLSTAQVNSRTVKPELYPQYLNFYENRPPAPAAMRKSSMNDGALMMAEESADMVSAGNYVEVSENMLNTQFDISIPYTINTGNTETVEIQDLNLPAKYTTYVVPKFDTNGFLVAEVSDWEKYNLMSAPAKIYLEGTFVGDSYLRTAGVEDKLKISLGRDERVEVKREAIKNYKSRKTFGSNVKESFGYELTFRNLKNEAVNILVEDQLPVSQNSDIEVEIEELSGGILDSEKGKVTWELNIPATQSSKLDLKYTVKYPKDKQVLNL
ncbi:DUF4139 domain-containing protein [uncultured Arcticibacterium sp.]|uniref:DUF4139 domain-containing protein n=1 Tax=uncultured Arcticibacterium sp. TaxID=2173042 RepID=UPI0030FAEC88